MLGNVVFSETVMALAKTQRLYYQRKKGELTIGAQPAILMLGPNQSAGPCVGLCLDKAYF